MPPPRILVTRSPHQASALADRLRALGAEPILIPTIELADPTSFVPLDAALIHLHRFHWMLFTSANAVEAFRRRIDYLNPSMQNFPSNPNPVILSGSEERRGGEKSKDLPHSLNPALQPEPFNLEPLKIAAIGSTTARALANIGLIPNLIPPQAVAESLTEALIPHALQPDGIPTRFLLIRAEDAREHLPENLRAAGAEVTIAPAYRTVIPAGSVDSIRELFSSPENYPDAITFTSASTARNLFTLLESAGVDLAGLSSVENLILASIGPVTSTALRELGYPPQVESPKADIQSLADALFENFDLKKTL